MVYKPNAPKFKSVFAQQRVKYSTMKNFLGIFAMILVLIGAAIGSPEPGFNRPSGRPGGIEGKPGSPPFINRPKPPQRPPKFA